MLINLTEVQVSCIVLMGLITLFLAFVLPTYTVAGRDYGHARKILSVGTFLVMLHFCVQYALHKHSQEVEVTRTIVNLLFGVPISYFINMSYIYLQRDGKVSIHHWLFAPFIWLVEIAVLVITWSVSQSSTATLLATYLMAMLYATTRFYYAYLIISEHRKIISDIRNGCRQHLVDFVKYTRWSMFLLVILALGFPLMAINNNILMRSVYGIIALSVSFFYFVSFAVYGIKNNTPDATPAETETEEEDKGETKEQLSITKKERMNRAVQKFIADEKFTHSSLTIKEAAEEMGISMNMLKIWLRHSEYEKYNNWITALRIAKAKELLLENPDMSYDDLSVKCGFCDRQYFYRLFKKHEGVSPAIWIKSRIAPN